MSFTLFNRRVPTTFLCPLGSDLPCVHKDQFKVQAGSKHKHVAVEFDLCDATGGQGVTDCHQAYSLTTGFI